MLDDVEPNGKRRTSAPPRLKGRHGTFRAGAAWGPVGRANPRWYPRKNPEQKEVAACSLT
ncbi:hypothetical protein GCM10027318_00310 [Massilia agilis]